MNLAKPFINALKGKPVSLVWRGYGSAIFLEFGDLENARTSRSKSKPSGEITLMIEWSWRIERPKSILCGSWSSERRWPAMFKKLIGSKVTNIEIFGPIPEIAISLSNGLRVVSFMVEEGQPQWALLTRHPKIGSLSVRKGSLYVEKPSS